MISILFCRSCGAALTGPLVILSIKDPANAAPEPKDREPVSPPGTAWKSYEPMVRSFEPGRPAPLEFTPQFWLNPLDVETTVQDVADRRKLSGCCGVAGHDGPNQRCRACKAELGTLMNDCFTALVFIPEPDATEWDRRR